ncbi:MAG: metallophosphoesterase [Ignavibacteriaceae bacterium]
MSIVKILNYSLLFIFIYISPQFAQTKQNEVQFNVNKRVILIGDVGEPAKDNKEPVLIALEKHAREIKDSTIILFLGDNIYPSGLMPVTHPDRTEYERRIDEQIEVVLNSHALGFFIPGNHDWGKSEHYGVEQIRRQSVYINTYGSEKISFKPADGCPGPEYFDYGDDLRIIFLDTQWWFNNDRIIEQNDCPTGSEDEIVEELSLLIKNSADRFIIIAAHHPLNTFGEHGGYFPLKIHLFPLTELNPYLLIPLPIIGSIYPLLRNMGINRQDISNPVYKNMINKIEPLLNSRNGIIYASGHEHSLQLLRGRNGNIYVVSGAGIYDLVAQRVSEGNETIYSEAAPGFFIIDFLDDGRIRLSAVEVVDRKGATEITYEIFTN